MYARTGVLRSLAAVRSGVKRVSDSAIEQLVLRWEKDSVAAMKMDASYLGEDDDEDEFCCDEGCASCVAK